MAAHLAHFGSHSRTAARFQSPSKNPCAILWPVCRDNLTMRTFGGFRSDDKFFYGEVRGNDVRALARPYRIAIEPPGEVHRLADVDVDLHVAPSHSLAVGLNSSPHI